jgi:hypothetical protein
MKCRVCHDFKLGDSAFYASIWLFLLKPPRHQCNSFKMHVHCFPFFNYRRSCSAGCRRPPFTQSYVMLGSASFMNISHKSDYKDNADHQYHGNKDGNKIRIQPMIRFFATMTIPGISTAFVIRRTFKILPTQKCPTRFFTNYSFVNYLRILSNYP